MPETVSYDKIFSYISRQNKLNQDKRANEILTKAYDVSLGNI